MEKSKFFKRAAFIMTVVITVLVLSWVIFIDVRREDSLQKEAKQSAEKSLENVLRSAEAVFERNESLSSTTAQFLPFIQKDSLAVKRKLSDLLKDNAEIEAVFCSFFEQNGDTSARSKTYAQKSGQDVRFYPLNDFISTIQQAEIRQRLSQSAGFYWEAPRFNALSGNMEMQIFAPITDSLRGIKGVFGMAVNLNWLNGIVAETFTDYEKDDDAFFLVVSSKGMVVSGIGGNFSVNQNILQDAERENDIDFASILIQMRNGDEGERRFSSALLDVSNEIFFKSLKGRNLSFALSFHDFPMIDGLRFILVITILIIVALAALITLWGWYSYRRRMKSIDDINEILLRIGLGETGVSTFVSSADEDMAEIVHQLTRMKSDLEVHIEKTKLSTGNETWVMREMEAAQQIRNYFHQNDIPRLVGLPGKNIAVEQAFGYMQKNIGGDFYDYFNISPQHACIVCGTVEGRTKTIQSSVNIVMTMTLIRSYVLHGRPLNLCLEYLNNAVMELSKKRFKVKLNIAVVDCETGAVSFANVKAPAPFYIKDKNILPLSADNGNPLGSVYNDGYSFAQKNLEAGEMIFFYTDGVARRKDSANDAFGMRRLEAALGAFDGKTPQRLIRDISNKIAFFSESQTDQTDDYTILAFQFLGKEKG